MPDQTIDIDAIRQREQAATEGPWRTAWPKGLHPWEVCISADVPLVELAHGEQGIADAEFIAHAREDIPALLAEVDELRAELEAARRSRFAYEERVADQVENLRTENERLAAERTQLVLDLGNMRGIAQGNMRYVATLTGLLDAVQAIAVDLRTPRWPGESFDVIADRLDRALTGGTASVPGSSRRAQECSQACTEGHQYDETCELGSSRRAQETDERRGAPRIVPYAERKPLYAAYRAAHAEADRIGGKLSDDSIVQAAVKAYEAERRAQEPTLTRRQWTGAIRAGGEALARLGPRATVWAGSSAVLNAAVPLLAGEAVTGDEAAAGEPFADRSEA